MRSLLRIAERVHGVSAATVVVIHPGTAAPVDRDRRWTTLFERSSALTETLDCTPAAPANRDALRSAR